MIMTYRTAQELGTAKADFILDYLSTKKSIPNTNDINTNLNIKRMNDELGKLGTTIRNEYPEAYEAMEKEKDITINDYQESREVELESIHRPSQVFFDKKAIINISKTHIPEDIQLALSFGPRFTFPPPHDTFGLTVLLDDMCSDVHDHFPDCTKTEANKHIHLNMEKVMLQYTLSKEQKWLLFIYYRTRKFFTEHSELKVARSDKGKHTVVLEKDVYIEKVNKLVLTNDYIKLHNFQIESLINKNNEITMEMLESKIIKSRHPLHMTHAAPAKFYGLIKIHKKDYPARPITAACGSPGFHMAKFMVEILQDIFDDKNHHVKNSVEFVNKLENMNIEEDECMVSFDVVSMFTSIPIDLVISIVSSRGDSIERKYNMKMELIARILTFLLRDCAIFLWQDNYYKQADSLAMGSPLSPIFADIVMTEILRVSLPGLPNQPKIMCVYVDDSFAIVKRNDVDLILEAFNSFNDNMRFTCEREKDGTICFLDVQVFRENTEIKTCWYKKPYASDRLLNFLSNHNSKCILGTAVAFIKTVLKLSHGSFFHQNKEVVEKILTHNSFPITSIIQILQSFYTYMRPIFGHERERKNYVPIKYVPPLNRLLIHKFKSLYPQAFFTAVPVRTHSKIFSNLKDSTNVNSKTNQIIHTECNCRKYVIIKHTSFGGTCREILEEIKKKYNTSKGRCRFGVHLFNKIYVNSGHAWYNKSIHKYKLHIYLFRKRLLDTPRMYPNNSTCKFIRKHLKDTDRNITK